MVPEIVGGGKTAMDGTTFGAWLDGIRGLTAEQRGQGFRALALAEAADGANPASLAPPTGVILMSSSLTIGGTPPGNSDFAVVRTRDVPANAAPAGSAPETASLAAAAQSKGGSHGLPSLRRSEASAMGACQRSATPPLRRLPAQFQRADRNAFGSFAHERTLGGAGTGSDHRRKPDQGGGTLRRRRHHRVPLAPQISFGAGARQTQPTHRDRRGRRDLYSGIVQGQAVRPTASRS